MDGFFRSPTALRLTYTALAPVYDALVPLVSSAARTAGLAFLDVADGEHVLEVGTGPGWAFRHLVAANPTGWTEGLDATPAMLTRTQSRMETVDHNRYGLRRGTVTNLPYPSGAFDALFSAYVVDLLPSSDLGPALNELRRVLRDDGRLVLVVCAPPHRSAGRCWTHLARACPFLLGGSRPLSLDKPLQQAGFRIQARTRCRQFGFPSAVFRTEPRCSA